MENGGHYYHSSVNRRGISQRCLLFGVFRVLDQRARDWRGLVGHSGKDFLGIVK